MERHTTWMLKRDQPYHDLGADWQERRNVEAHTRRLLPRPLERQVKTLRGRAPRVRWRGACRERGRR